MLIQLLWKPASRKSYAAKFSLWPAIFFSSQLAGPLARTIFGVPGPYTMQLDEALKGVFVLATLPAPIFFGIGYWFARKKLFSA